MPPLWLFALVAISNQRERLSQSAAREADKYVSHNKAAHARVMECGGLSNE